MLHLDTTLAVAESASFFPAADFTLQASLDPQALATVTVYGREDAAAAWQIATQWKPLFEPFKTVTKMREMKVRISRNIAGRQARVWSQLDTKELKSVSGYRIGVIGTSLCQHNDLGAVSFSKISHSSRGWMSWARFYSQGLFTSPVWWDDMPYVGWEPAAAGSTRYFQGLNAGVFSQTADQILARKEFLTKNIDCDIVVIDAGTNDTATLTKEEIQTKRETLADFYLDQGKIVILFPILARSVAVWPAGGTTRARMQWVNSKTREFCRKRRNCFFFDWNEPWVDVATANGPPKTGYSSDGTHLVPKGGEAIGKAFADFLKTILPAGQKRLSSNDNAYHATDNPRGNLMVNPFLIGTAGSNGGAYSTGQVATGMVVERISGGSTVVNSLEARPGRGNYQVLTFTPTGTVEDVFYFRPSATSGNIAHTLTDQDWVQASCEIETNDYAGLIGVSLLCLDLATGGHYSYGMEHYNNGSANEKWLAQARAGHILTPPFKIKAGSVNLKWRVEIRLDPNVAGTPVIKIGALELSPVEDPRAALNWVAPA